MSKMSSTVFILMNLIILYIVFYNMPSFKNKKQIFGVSINDKYLNYYAFKNLCKEYKKLINLIFLFILISSFIFIFVFNKTDFASIYSILAMVLLNFIVYINVHNKAKIIKLELINSNSEDVSPSSKIIIDSVYICERNKIIKKFKIMYLIPLLILLISSIYTFFNYNNIPNSIPIHWNLYGIADSFIDKSYTNIILIVLGQFMLSLLLAFTSLSSIKSRVKIDTKDNIEKSKSENISYLNKIGYTFLVLIVSINLILVNSFISYVNGPNLNLYITILSFILMVASIIYLMFVFIKSPNMKTSSSFSSDEDENYWIFGCLYNNPNDPSFMVEKKFGIGWTVNIATPLGKIFMVSLIIVFIISIYELISSFFV